MTAPERPAPWARLSGTPPSHPFSAIVIMTRISKFFLNEDGATAVEYALMLALIAIVIVAAVEALGLAVKGGFEAGEQAFP
jgi:pilus assembly protein Flp/PilA